jgi:hypothetical protein
MANAADYLLLDTAQLLTTYKLRTRSIEARKFVATNIAPNYILSVNIVPTIDGVVVTPSAFTLQPDEVVTITVEYDSSVLETLPPGTLEGALNMSVSAVPVVVPQIPTPPALPPLPEAPRQIISRIEITPTNFTLSEVGETKQFNAVLYVDDVATPATFNWALQNDLNGAFSIEQNTGIVKALSTGINKAIVEATIVTPSIYVGTTGLSIVTTNVPIIVPTGGEPIPTTGNLRVVVNAARGIGGNVNISGINQSITKTTTFNNIPAGTYTVTPNVVTSGNENYNPTGGGQIYVGPGQSVEVAVDYTLQSPPDINSIQILSISNTAGNLLTQGSTVNVGDRIKVTATTYKNGNVTNIGDVQFTANNTQEGVQTVQAQADGIYTAQFIVTEPGIINVSAFNTAAGSVTGQLNAIRTSIYTIRLSAPTTLITGQCSPVTAIVLQDGMETNIPVELNIVGMNGRISSDPCGVAQPAPTFGGGNIIVDTGTAGSGGTIPRGEFNQTAMINQGINAI